MHGDYSTYKLAGKHAVTRAPENSWQLVLLHTGQPCTPVSCPSKRASKCLGRFIEQGSSGRLVIGSGGFSCFGPQAGCAGGGSLPFQWQCQVRKKIFPGKGGSYLGLGWLNNPVELFSRVRFLSFATHSSSYADVQAGIDGSDPDHSILALQSLVLLF